MKARFVWISIAVVFIVLVGVRVFQAQNAANQKAVVADESQLVRTATVGYADLTERVSATGTIRPKNEVDVYSKVPGRVESLAVALGDKVRAGQLLATVEHNEIGWQSKAQEAALRVAKANHDGALLDFQRTEVLFKGGSAPQAQIDQAKVRLALAEAQVAQAQAAAGLAAQQLQNSRIESPISGTIVKKSINVGVQVGPQMPVFTVSDVAALKLETSVDAESFIKLKKGAAAAITVDALPNETFRGTISVLSPSLDAQTRRATIEIEIDNTAGRLMPNMFAHADVTVGVRNHVLAVPVEAVLDAPGSAIVYRLRGNKIEALRPKLGARDGPFVAVNDGLNAGDVVAAGGLAALTDGAAVRVQTEPQAKAGERKP